MRISRRRHILERNVVGVYLLLRLLRRFLVAIFAPRGPSRLRSELDIVYHDLRGISLPAFFLLPGTIFDPTRNKDLLSLLYVLRRKLRGFSEEYEIVKLRTLVFLAVLVLVDMVRSESDLADVRSRR